MPRSGEDDIPANLAASLKRQGLTWEQVGRSIARQRGREVPYRGDSVRAVVAKSRKAALKNKL